MLLFGMASQKTSDNLLILLTRLLISPLLRLHSPLLLSAHDSIPNSILTLLLLHVCHHHRETCLTPALYKIECAIARLLVWFRFGLLVSGEYPYPGRSRRLS